MLRARKAEGIIEFSNTGQKTIEITTGQKLSSLGGKHQILLLEINLIRWVESVGISQKLGPENMSFWYWAQT